MSPAEGGAISPGRWRSNLPGRRGLRGGDARGCWRREWRVSPRGAPGSALRPASARRDHGVANLGEGGGGEAAVDDGVALAPGALGLGSEEAHLQHLGPGGLGEAADHHALEASPADLVPVHLLAGHHRGGRDAAHLRADRGRELALQGVVARSAERQHGDARAGGRCGDQQDERGEARGEERGRHRRGGCPSLSRDPAIHHCELARPCPSPRCSPGALGRRARLDAVSTSAMWLKACGKLPTSRSATGSYSSLRRPTSLRSERSRSKSARASSCRSSLASASASQKLHGRNAPSSGREPVHLSLLGPVAEHEAVVDQLALDGLHRRHHPRVLRRQEADLGDEEQARVERIAPVELGEAPPRRVPALLADVGVDPVAHRAPAVDRALEPELLHHFTVRSSATQHITLEWVKWRRGPRTSQMPSSGWDQFRSSQCMNLRLPPARRSRCWTCPRGRRCRAHPSAHHRRRAGAG